MSQVRVAPQPETPEAVFGTDDVSHVTPPTNGIHGGKLEIISMNSCPDLRPETSMTELKLPSPTADSRWEGDDTKFSWDYCLVFKVLTPEEEEAKNNKLPPKKKKYHFARDTKEYIDAINKAGLRTYQYLSVQEDEVYCLIGITERRLREEADRVDYDLMLDVDRIIDQGMRYGPHGEPLPLIKGLTSSHPRDVLLSREKWDERRFYGTYNKFDPEIDAGPSGRNRQELYLVLKEADPDRPPTTLFRPIDRLRLIFNILESPRPDGAGLSLFRLKRSKKSPLCEAFPIHKDADRNKLEKEWMGFWPLFTQPLSDVRNYYGEKVGMYFAFLEFYTKWLLIPALCGIIVFCQQLAHQMRVDVSILPFAGFFVALWAALFLEYWKRREATLRSDWGQTHFVIKEPLRPEFEGDKLRDPTSGKVVRYFYFYNRFLRIIKSQTVLLTLIVVVLGLVVSVVFLRAALKGVAGEEYGAIAAAGINFVQIQLMNYIYGLVANKLNDYENHKTASAWENALIFKSFMFRFVNCYNSFFYIAFFKQFDESNGGCVPPEEHCLPELQIQLAVIFGSTIVVNNAMELAVPFFQNMHKSRANDALVDAEPTAQDKLNRRLSQRKVKKVKSQPEEQAEYEPYETFSDYDEMVVQFGYVTIFVVAFPMAPAMAVLNNYFEIRIDAHKILRLCQRPQPQGCAFIGTWFDILTLVSFIAVLVNTIICVFYTKIIDKWCGGSFQTKVLVFVICEHIIIILKVLIAYFVLDEPEPVTEHNVRQEFLVEVLIKGAVASLDDSEDDDDDDEDEPTQDSEADAFASGLDYTTIAKIYPSAPPYTLFRGGPPQRGEKRTSRMQSRRSLLSGGDSSVKLHNAGNSAMPEPTYATLSASSYPASPSVNSSSSSTPTAVPTTSAAVVFP
eukprot:gb/GEZN01000987.1/.p1 GENE.gb/GEZN01000987.1/~~gb/GEZN01000987.1/.p1  ORF type:complete len:903 (+),score=148.12 gb/GEZN01000987.1/:28-2736(+)